MATGKTYSIRVPITASGSMVAEDGVASTGGAKYHLYGDVGTENCAVIASYAKIPLPPGVRHQILNVEMHIEAYPSIGMPMPSTDEMFHYLDVCIADFVPIPVPMTAPFSRNTGAAPPEDTYMYCYPSSDIPGVAYKYFRGEFYNANQSVQDRGPDSEPAHWISGFDSWDYQTYGDSIYVGVLHGQFSVEGVAITQANADIATLDIDSPYHVVVEITFADSKATNLELLYHGERQRQDSLYNYVRMSSRSAYAYGRGPYAFLDDGSQRPERLEIGFGISSDAENLVSIGLIRSAYDTAQTMAASTNNSMPGMTEQLFDNQLEQGVDAEYLFEPVPIQTNGLVKILVDISTIAG